MTNVSFNRCLLSKVLANECQNSCDSVAIFCLKMKGWLDWSGLISSETRCHEQWNRHFCHPEEKKSILFLFWIYLKCRPKEFLKKVFLVACCSALDHNITGYLTRVPLEGHKFCKNLFLRTETGLSAYWLTASENYGGVVFGFFPSAL